MAQPMHYRHVDGEAHSYEQLRRSFLKTVREERIAGLNGEDQGEEKDVEMKFGGAETYRRACAAAKEALADGVGGDGGNKGSGRGGGSKNDNDGSGSEVSDDNGSSSNDDNSSTGTDRNHEYNVKYKRRPYSGTFSVDYPDRPAGAAAARARRRSRFVEVRDPNSRARRSLAAATASRAAAYRVAYAGAMPLEREQIRRGVVLRPGISIFSKRKIYA